MTKYYYAGSQRIAIPQGDDVRKNGVLSYIFGDHVSTMLNTSLGSTNIVTDDVGNVISETKYKACPLRLRYGMLREGEERYSSGANPSEYTFTGQYFYTSDFGLMFYNARWYDPSLGRFAQADTIVPLMQGTQAWDRYAYVNNNPLRYIDPTGHRCEPGDNEPGGYCDGTPTTSDDILLSGFPDSVTITLTADELLDISDEINEDVNGDDGIRENASSAANTWSTVNDLGNLVVGTVISGIACSATLGACVFIVGGAFYLENRLTNSVIEQSAASSYEDLQETSLYFESVAHQIDPNHDSGSTEIAIEIYTTLGGGVYIQADNIQGNVSVSAGIYHYNYDIAPYLQP